MPTVGTHHVYLRTRWSDEWTLAPDLHCLEAVWTAAPSIPTATLLWHYGLIAPTGTLSFREVLKRRSVNRVWVWIRFDLEQTLVDGVPTFAQRHWYGVIEVDEDLHHGEVTDAATLQTIATGEQTLTAYGMEHLLDRELIWRSWFDDDGTPTEVERALVFNRDGRPNRAAAGFAAGFSSSPDNAAYWSTRDIVRYLLAFHAPANAAGDAPLTWILGTEAAMEDAVPHWDRPVLDPSGRTVYSCLTSLIARGRLCSFYAHTLAGAGIVSLRAFTFTDVPVNTRPGGRPIPRNANRKILRFGKDQSAEGAVKTSTLDHYDQVIVRGARRRAVFSLSYLDNTLEKGWTGTAEADYETGASGADGYAALSTDDKRRRNAEARARESLKHVFRRFALPEPWDGLAGDGAGGDKHPVFVGIDLATLLPFQVPHYDPEVFVEQTMPLIEGLDYSGQNIQNGTVANPDQLDVEAPPLVLWKHPDTGVFANIEKLSDKSPTTDDRQQLDWSASVLVPREDRAILLHVSGAPQHVLDSLDFDPLPADEDQGAHNWRTMVVTLSVQEDRFADAKFPLDDALPGLASGDYVRRLVIDAGEGYKLDYVCAHTVVGVDAAGQLLRTDSGGFVNDDRLELNAIARIAYAYYSRLRRVLYFATEQLTSQLEVGDMIVEVGAFDIDLEGTHHTLIRTPVTEIRITTPYGTTEEMPEPPKMRVVTDAGQLDALGWFTGATPEPVPAQPARPLNQFDAAHQFFDPAAGPYGAFRSTVGSPFFNNPHNRGFD